MGKTVYIRHTTFSCALNGNNASRLRAYLETNGWSIVDSPEKADLIVYSGCAFNASMETLSLVELKYLHEVARSSGREASVVCAGCMPLITATTQGQLEGQSFTDIHPTVACSKPNMHLLDEAIEAQTPFRDIPYPFDIRHCDLADLATIRLEKVLPRPIARLFAKIYGRFAWSYERDCGEFLYVTKHGYAFLVPGEGCQNACTYCCIKFAKQEPVSVPLDRVMARVQQAIDAGAKGVFFMPDDLGSWGKDLGERWTTLVRTVCAMEGEFGLAFYNLHAADFVEDGQIFDAVAEQRRLKLLGIMVQHVHADVLTRMNRRPFDVEKMIERLEWFSRRGVHVLTHLIPCFPGETEVEFEALRAFVRRVAPFTEVHLYRYERREGTVASRELRDWELPEELSRRRYETLLAELPSHMALGKPSRSKSLRTKLEQGCLRLLEWYEAKKAAPAVPPPPPASTPGDRVPKEEEVGCD